MVISKEKLNKASKVKNIFTAAKFICVIAAIAATILAYFVLDSSVIPHFYAIFLLVAFIVITGIFFHIPDMQSSAMLKAVGLSSGQTVYIACVERRPSVEETYLTGICPWDEEDPIVTAEIYKFYNVETCCLYLTHEEAQRALDESIEQLCDSIKKYIGCSDNLSDEAKAKLAEYYSQYVRAPMSRKLDRNKYLDPDWLPGLVGYIVDAEKRKAREKAEREDKEKAALAALREAVLKAEEDKKALKGLIS